MGGAQLVILIVSALLGATLTGVGTYADSRDASAQNDLAMVLSHDAAPWWWAGAGAVLLVGAGIFRRADRDPRRRR